MKRYVVTVAAFLLIIGALVGLWLSERNATEDKNEAEQGQAKANKTALAYEDSLEDLCANGYKSACRELQALPDVPDVDDPEIQDVEIDDPDPDDPESQDPEIQDPENQDPDKDDADPDDSENQDPENQDDEINDLDPDDPDPDDPDPDDPENQDPEINDPDPNDPPVCEGEFVCQGELDAAIAQFVTMAQVLAAINDALAPLGCEVTVGDQGPPLVLSCSITGKPS